MRPVARTLDVRTLASKRSGREGPHGHIYANAPEQKRNGGLTIVTAGRLKLVLAAVVLSSSIACTPTHSLGASFSAAREDLKADLATSVREPAQTSSLCTYRFGHDLGAVVRTSESEYDRAEYDLAIDDAELLKRAVQVCSANKGLWLRSTTMFADDVLIKSYVAKGQRERARRYSQEALASANAVLADPGAIRPAKEAAGRISRVAKDVGAPSR
jgi:hypothetical protein